MALGLSGTKVKMLGEAVCQHPQELLVWACLHSSLSPSPAARGRAVRTCSPLPAGRAPAASPLRFAVLMGKCAHCQWLDLPAVLRCDERTLQESGDWSLD